MNVLQLALNALEYTYKEGNSVADAIEALRKALEQEPVAWMWTVNNGGGYSSRGIGFEQTDIPFAVHTPLYTQPKKWVGLTDEEREEIHDSFEFQNKWDGWEYEKAIEAKLREKNEH